MVPRDRKLTIQRDPGFAGAVLLGVLTGLCHTVAEGTLMGWYGVGIRPVDLLLFTASYCALGALFGVAFFFGLWLLRKAVGCKGKPDGYALFLILAAMAYGLFVAKQTADHISGSHSYAIMGLFGVFLLLFVLLATRRRYPYGAMVPALLGLSFCAVSATLISALWYDLSQESARIRLCLSMCLPPVLSLGALFAAGMQKAPPNRVSGHAALAGGLVYACHLALWFLFWPIQVGWHVDHPNPTTILAAKGKPNVLLLVLDTVRARNMELYGYTRETMPFLTEFAEQECDHVAEMLANASSTLPTHASMFTGHFVYSHGAHKPFLFEKDAPPLYCHSLDDTYPTIAQWLGGAGYQTAGISGNYGVLSGYGLRRGFGHYDCRESDTAISRRISWLFSFRVAGRLLGSALRYRLPDPLASATVCFTRRRPNYRRAERINALAYQWLAERKDAPFFLFLNFMDAHDPYLPPSEYRERFGQEGPGINWMGFPDELYRAALYEGKPMPEQDLEYTLSQYDAELAYVDDQVAQLVRHLKEIGCFDRTLIIIASDHGEAFWEHGAMLHGSTLYNTQTAVPLLVKLPLSAEQKAVKPSPYMQQVDFLPTIAEVLQIEPPPEIQGRPWGKGRYYALAENYVHWGRHPKFHRELVTVQAEGFKYIHSTTGEEEVYDLANDPEETRNLIEGMSEFVKRMKGIKEQRVQPPRKQPRQGEENEALREKLRSLGYL